MRHAGSWRINKLGLKVNGLNELRVERVSKTLGAKLTRNPLTRNPLTFFNLVPEFIQQVRQLCRFGFGKFTAGHFTGSHKSGRFDIG